MKSKIKLGEVYLDAVVEELPSSIADITDKAVEQGQDISDHIQQKPALVRLSGYMVNDAASKLDILRNYQKNGDLLKYVGRNAFENMVIERLETDHGLNTANGYKYDITIKQVRISQPETFILNIKPPDKPVGNNKAAAKRKMATKVKKKTNTGRKQTKSKKTSQQTKNIMKKLTANRLSSNALGELPKIKGVGI